MRILIALLGLLYINACAVNICMPEAKVQAIGNKYDIGQAHKSVGSVFVRQINGKLELRGTVFAIDKDYLLTAGHVCVGIAQFQDMGLADNNIRMDTVRDGHKGSLDHIEIMEIDEPHDICLMKKVDHGLDPLELTSNFNKDLKFRDIVWIVGAPLGIVMAEAEGRVMDANPNLSPPAKGLFIVSAAAAGGNSGSPVINEQGKVVGILVAGVGAFDHLSFCVKSSTVQRFLKIVGYERRD